MEISKEEKIKSLIGEEWYNKIGTEFDKQYLLNLNSKIAYLRKTTKVYPNSSNVLRAYRLTPYKSVKVVIFGQDPYHNGTADGLCFSSGGMRTPASLRIMFKEIKRTYPEFNEGRLPDLTDWAEQGVFLLNTILTVEEGQPLSHAGLGWEHFTKETIVQLNKHPNSLVFVLMGNKAKEYKNFIDGNYHHVIETNHPAYELHNEEGFTGNNLFLNINNYLNKTYGITIKW